MKRIATVFLCAILGLTLFGCKKEELSTVKIDYGTSSVYTKEDMDSAVKVIKEKFSTLEGCELHSLSYTSDESCNTAENIVWMNELGKGTDQEEVFTQCISFGSSFRSPLDGGLNWQANEEYTWTWWLARSEGGAWKLMTFGY